jgi:hypothetical protein
LPQLSSTLIDNSPRLSSVLIDNSPCLRSSLTSFVLAVISDLKMIHDNLCSRDWIGLKVPTSELNSGHQGNSMGSCSAVIQLGMGLDVLDGLQSWLIELSRKIQASNTAKDDVRGYALTPRHMRSNWISCRMRQTSSSRHKLS